MRKTLVIIMALILVLTLVACGSSGIPSGSYKMTRDTSPYGFLFEDCTTLEVNSDGSASLIMDFGEGYVDTTAVYFDESSGTVTFDESKANYTISGGTITFTFSNGDLYEFKKK